MVRSLDAQARELNTLDAQARDYGGSDSRNLHLGVVRTSRVKARVVPVVALSVCVCVCVCVGGVVGWGLTSHVQAGVVPVVALGPGPQPAQEAPARSHPPVHARIRNAPRAVHHLRPPQRPQIIPNRVKQPLCY